jgi:hypothetical protein
VFVGSGEGVAVSVGTGEGVFVGSGEGVAVSVGTGEGVFVGSGEGVAVSVGVGCLVSLLAISPGDTSGKPVGITVTVSGTAELTTVGESDILLAGVTVALSGV